MSGKTLVAVALAALGGLLVGVMWSQKDDPPTRQVADGGPDVVLAVHGGAGVLDDAEMRDAGTTAAQYEEALADALRAGYAALRAGGAVDAVEQAVRVLEDSPLFNAGKGAALSADGQARLDAAIMDGAAEAAGEALGRRDPRRRAGAVADVRHVKNPVSAARAVMEADGARVVLLVGDGAEAFALGDDVKRRYRIERVENEHFHTPWRKKLLRDAQERQKKRASSAGTVGAVARKGGRLAAATSTGGLTNKPVGRVGDTPLIGAGTYADDRACAVSCTGTGEVFIRHAVAYDVVARMLYSTPRPGVAEAARATVDALPDEADGVGSLIALDGRGNHAFAPSPRLAGTYRGYVTAGGELFVATLKGEPKRVGTAE